MTYTRKHAHKAVEILQKYLPYVSKRVEYMELVEISSNESRWREAHDVFRRIRRNITLPFDANHPTEVEYAFVFIAECAAKTIYNCSGEPAPFDDDSYEWLLKCEENFLQTVKHLSN